MWIRYHHWKAPKMGSIVVALGEPHENCVYIGGRYWGISLTFRISLNYPRHDPLPTESELEAEDQ